MYSLYSGFLKDLLVKSYLFSYKEIINLYLVQSGLINIYVKQGGKGDKAAAPPQKRKAAPVEEPSDDSDSDEDGRYLSKHIYEKVFTLTTLIFCMDISTARGSYFCCIFMGTF